MSDIIEELKQAFTIEVSVPFVDGLSIDLIQVAAFIVIFGGVLGSGRIAAPLLASTFYAVTGERGATGTGALGGTFYRGFGRVNRGPQCVWRPARSHAAVA